jgi:hypothetical protein
MVNKAMDRIIADALQKWEQAYSQGNEQDCNRQQYYLKGIEHTLRAMGLELLIRFDYKCTYTIKQL